jgi:hypothetical protein
MSFTPVATTDTLETFRTRYNATNITLVDDSSSSVDITLATDSLKISGGTGTASVISGDTLTLNLSNTGVSAGSVGSSTAIPVLAINAQGQITSASTASISTDLTLVDDASTAATISLATDTLKISGGTGTTSAISGDTVTINLDNTAVSAGSVGSSSAIPVLTIDAQGRITAASTASVSSDLTIVDDSSTSETITLGSETLKFAGGTGVTTAITSGTVTISKSTTASRTLFKYTATSSQTTFSGSDANGNTLAYVSGSFDVFLNGVLLDATDFTASNGTSVVLASAAAANDILTVLAYETDNLATFDCNGSELILDADADTSIHANTDDQIDIKIAGADDFQFTANDFSVLSGSTLNIDSGGTIACAGTLSTGFVGKQSMWIPASSMYPNSTSGCADLTQVELSNGPEIKVLDFDPSSDENAQFTVAFPKEWNEGTVTFQAFFTVTGTNTGTTAWGLSGVAFADNGDQNTAFGTNVVATAKAHSGTSNDLDVSAESGAVTIAGSPSTDELVYFQVMRDVSADNQSGDARLLGIKLFFTTDALTSD